MKTNKKIFRSALCSILLMAATPIFAQQAGTGNTQSKVQDEKPIPVTWETFVRAESDKNLKTMLISEGSGSFSISGQLLQLISRM